MALLTLGLPAALAGAARREGAATAGVSLCVISPRITDPTGTPPTALVAFSRPTVFVVEPLTEVQILEGKQLLWSERAGERAASGPMPISGAPAPLTALEGPMAWPLPAIRPGQSLILRLRPPGSGPDDFAVVRLIAPAAEVLGRGDSLLASLGRDPGRWLAAVLAALDHGHLPLASALLFAFEGPGAPELNALRLQVIRSSCPTADTPGR